MDEKKNESIEPYCLEIFLKQEHFERISDEVPVETTEKKIYLFNNGILSLYELGENNIWKSANLKISQQSLEPHIFLKDFSQVIVDFQSREGTAYYTGGWEDFRHDSYKLDAIYCTTSDKIILPDFSNISSFKPDFKSCEKMTLKEYFQKK